MTAGHGGAVQNTARVASANIRGAFDDAPLARKALARSIAIATKLGRSFVAVVTTLASVR